MTTAVAMSAESWAIAAYISLVFVIIVIMLGASWFLGGRAWGRAKNEPFESGVVGSGSPRLRLSAKFYLVAMLFVIFDVEAVLLFAWAVSVRETGWVGFAGASIFIAILVVGLVYEWAIGALEWAPDGRRQRAKARPQK